MSELLDGLLDDLTDLRAAKSSDLTPRLKIVLPGHVLVQKFLWTLGCFALMLLYLVCSFFPEGSPVWTFGT